MVATNMAGHVQRSVFCRFKHVSVLKYPLAYAFSCPDVNMSVVCRNTFKDICSFIYCLFFLVNVMFTWKLSQIVLAVRLQNTQNVKLNVHHQYPSFPSRFPCNLNLNSFIFWSFQDAPSGLLVEAAWLFKREVNRQLGL